MRDAAAVVDGRGGGAVQLGVVGQRLGDQLVPPAEPDQHVHPQGHERLQPVGHRRRLDREQLGRELRREFVGGLQRRRVLALEHRRVDDEVQVVRPVQRVEVQRTRAVDEPPICLHRSVIGHDRAAVVTAQHVDVAGHVLQVAGVGHQAAQQVGRGQGVLGVRRHLHGVQVEVQHAGMAPARLGGERVVEDPLGLERRASPARARRSWCPTTPMR